MSAREEVLGRIRQALGRDDGGGAAAASPAHGEGAAAGGTGVGGYRRESGLDAEALVELLVDRLVDYKALVEVVDAGQLAGALQDRLGGKTFVVPSEIPRAWLSEELVRALADGRGRWDSREEPVEVPELDGIQAVLTSSAVSIADTGTIILDGSPDQGRRAISLVPDHHVCVVPVETITGIVPEAFARLDMTRPLTMISGPSATSDIELERVEGVHGPRTLDVLIVR